jgi:hypothetical protein
MQAMRISLYALGLLAPLVSAQSGKALVVHHVDCRRREVCLRRERQEKCSGDDYKVWVNITEYYACEACNEKISGAIEYEAGVLSGPPPIGQAAETGVIQPTNNVINALSRLRTSGLNCYPRQKTQEEKNWREIQWNNEFEIDKEI